MVWEDPIVAETGALRRELMDEVGNDLDALVAFLKQRELERARCLVAGALPFAYRSARPKRKSVGQNEVLHC
jgi:hypothetical protein